MTPDMKDPDDQFVIDDDGWKKGNPGLSSYAFCLRDEHGDIIYAEAAKLHETTNTITEALAVLKATTHCKQAGYNQKGYDVLAAGDIDVKGTSLPSDMKQHPMSKTQSCDHRHPENTTSKIRIVHFTVLRLGFDIKDYPGAHPGVTVFPRPNYLECPTNV
ncbi:hypothetical protein FXO38_19402 [Capsicum annuum]|nr:hypothetical protein FXO38_19402 [Capsicum annuum]